MPGSKTLLPGRAQAPFGFLRPAAGADDNERRNRQPDLSAPRMAVPNMSACVVARLLANLAFGWTLERLPEQVGTARSVPGERYTRFIVLPPMTYLTLWRAQLAADRLLDAFRFGVWRLIAREIP